MGSPKFLVVDANADDGAILARTISRKYPDASVEVRPYAGGAIDLLTNSTVNAVVLHRSDVEDAVRLIRAFKLVAPTVPIVAVCGADRRDEVMAAGASAFMLHDEWLRLGAVVQTVLDSKEVVSESP